MDDHEHTSRLEDRHLSPSSKLAHPSSESGVAVPTLPALCLGLSMGFSEAAPSTAGKRVFTFMQMQELEQQALIYKYMVAGLPVPLHLVLPIWKSVAASAYGSNYFPSLKGCGSGLCFDYRNCLDPDPGRCRRTDGKKWRCSHDAVPEHKYCERHMYRGRNRSRKPVEASQDAFQTSKAARKDAVPPNKGF
ncbi:hypothetical protein HPP92_021936 [Vanilla planifolia]|uniref:Growth-regulating factor n=1 Tax=Vanilla planifolia TaxID=51239 RepID=A0A835PX91_VANPL|nr:hypothetical protein HPP92_021936 [Vanilla planifolia]